MKKEDDDIVIEDVLGQYRKAQAKRSKRINTNKKGGGFQRKTAKKLESAYQEKFASTPGSGGIATARSLDDNASEVLAGDIMVGGLMFTIECKKGYDNIDLFDLLATVDDRGAKSSKMAIKAFLDQAEEATKKSNKHPLLVWSKTRKHAICAMRRSEYDGLFHYFVPDHGVMFYAGYAFFAFDEFVKIPKNVIFKPSTPKCDP